LAQAGGGVRAQRQEAHSEKKEGRHFPWKSPGAPNSTGAGAGAGRFAAITMVSRSYSQQKNDYLCKKQKAPAPPGAENNADTRAAALRLPSLSAFLASPRNVARAW